MKLENQVCSFELSKRLEELGVKQESCFYWIIDNEYSTPELSYKNHNLFLLSDDKNTACDYISYLESYSRLKVTNIYSAFTVAELGEMLQWEKLYIFEIPKELLDYIDGKNSEADARAKMLIYLLENKLMELSK